TPAGLRANLGKRVPARGAARATFDSVDQNAGGSGNSPLTPLLFAHTQSLFRAWHRRKARRSGGRPGSDLPATASSALPEQRRDAGSLPFWHSTNLPAIVFRHTLRAE